MDELIEWPATAVVDALRGGEISVAETLDVLEARIAAVDDRINALPTRCFDRAREWAATRDFRGSPLAGLPIAIKDLDNVAGVRTTYGSAAYADHVPQSSDLLVESIEARGGVVYAKSNTPEFGSGGNTFNTVFGATRNPFDLSLSAGGSSGGAAAALATRCAWLAQGSDLGGSLRTPASFCGVASLRPSPGLIACGAGLQPFDVYAQKGPMARTLAELALFADALAGPSSRAGLAKPHAEGEFAAAVAAPRRPARVAVSADLGVAATSGEIRGVFDAAIALLQRDGIDIEHAHPDLSAADCAFDAPRALGYALAHGADLERIRPLIKPENVWNIEYGLRLSSADVLDSMAAQGEIFGNGARFMQDFDLLLCPANIVAPYPVEERYPGYGDGVEYPDYYRWLRICYALTMTTLPVITLPAGLTPAGMPQGIQLVGKAHGERELFAFAAWLEALFAFAPPPLDPAIAQ